MSSDGSEDVMIAINSGKNIRAIPDSITPLQLPGSVLCVKASMLLQVSLTSFSNGCNLVFMLVAFVSALYT